MFERVLNVPLRKSWLNINMVVYSLGIVGAVLMGISIFLMLANIAFDIYLQIEGCCGLFPVACDYAKEFEEITDDLKIRADRMNTEYTISMNLLEYISRTNQNNGDIWVELSRILILTERVITRIDPKLLTRFNNQSMILKVRLWYCTFSYRRNFFRKLFFISCEKLQDYIFYQKKRSSLKSLILLNYDLCYTEVLDFSSELCLEPILHLWARGSNKYCSTRLTISHNTFCLD